MMNQPLGVNNVHSAAAWATPNMNRESSQARADAAKFSDELKHAQEKLEDAKASLNTSNISADAEARRLREACQGFEAMFLDIVFKEMRNTVPENTLFGESQGEKIWHSMLDTELMNNVAKAGGVGIADMMYDNLIGQVTAQTLSAKGLKP